MKMKMLFVILLGITFVFPVLSPGYAGPKQGKPKYETWEERREDRHEDRLEEIVVREVVRGLVRVLTAPDRPYGERVIIVDNSQKKVIENKDRVVVLVADDDFQIEVDEGTEVVNINKGTKVEVEEGTHIIVARDDREIEIEEGATLLVVRDYPAIIPRSSPVMVRVVTVRSRPVVLRRPVRFIHVYRNYECRDYHRYDRVVIRPKVKIKHNKVKVKHHKIHY